MNEAEKIAYREGYNDCDKMTSNLIKEERHRTLKIIYKEMEKNSSFSISRMELEDLNWTYYE
jgi:hypothetical protein